MEGVRFGGRPVEWTIQVKSEKIALAIHQHGWQARSSPGSAGGEFWFTGDTNGGGGAAVVGIRHNQALLCWQGLETLEDRKVLAIKVSSGHEGLSNVAQQAVLGRRWRHRGCFFQQAVAERALTLPAAINNAVHN